MTKRAKLEEIIAKLREFEVRLSQGESVGMAAKSIGVHRASFMVDLLASRVSPAPPRHNAQPDRCDRLSAVSR